MVRAEPLSYYVDKLERGEPFTSVLYGDGEFYVAARLKTGSRLQHGEIVTPRLEEEMLAALAADGPDLFRGTDPHLIYPETYQGRDGAGLRAMCDRFHTALPGLRDREWVDGVVWDRAARDGELGPLLKALRGRKVFLVGNQKLAEGLKACRALLPWGIYVVRPENAAADLDQMTGTILELFDRSYCADMVYVLCCGLSAIPLAMKIRAAVPTATVLDLGSVLDVFAGIGAERGWRAHLYAQPGAREALVAKHLEGVC